MFLHVNLSYLRKLNSWLTPLVYLFVYLQHYDRNFHSHSGNVIKRDSGIWYMPVDTNGDKMMELYDPEFMSQARRATCDGVYCGRPYLYPFLKEVDAKYVL